MRILKHGTLKNKTTGVEENYYIRELDLRDFDKLVKLEKIVFQNMDRMDLYAGLTDEEFNNMLGDDGVVVGAFVKDELIGFYAILFPGVSAYNLGNDIGIAQKDMDDVIHVESAGVHPEFRGNSLQKTMTGICLDEAKKIKQIKYVCATVSPYNYPSIDHIFALGLYIRDIKLKYDDMLRYICLGEMESKKSIIKDSIVEIVSTDHNEQLRLLKDGFIGFRLTKTNKTNYISFGKLEL